MKSRPIKRTDSARLVEWLYEEDERLGILLNDYNDSPSHGAAVRTGLALLADIAKGLGRVEVAIDMLAEDIRRANEQEKSNGSQDD